MPRGEKNIIKVENISKSFQTSLEKTTILKDISIQFQRGTWTSILGPSGSGKSTFLNCISGLLEPDSGKIQFNEMDLYELMDGERSNFRLKNIGFIFQDFKLLPQYSVLQNVMLPLIYNKPKMGLKEKAKEILTQVGIEQIMFNRLPEGLSGGEKQRAAIARSLIANPNVLICDEPTGNLDSKNRDNIISILKNLKAQGSTIILVTHDIHVANQGDFTYYLNNGRLVFNEVM